MIMCTIIPADQSRASIWGRDLISPGVANGTALALTNCIILGHGERPARLRAKFAMYHWLVLVSCPMSITVGDLPVLVRERWRVVSS